MNVQQMFPIVLISALAFFSFGCVRHNKPEVAAIPTPDKNSDIKPIFNATELVGKNPTNVNKILGNPTDTWTPRDDPEGQLQSHSIGEDTTVEFHDDRIKVWSFSSIKKMLILQRPIG